MGDGWTTVSYKKEVVPKDKKEYVPSYTKDEDVTILHKQASQKISHRPSRSTSSTVKGKGGTKPDDENYVPTTFGDLGKQIEQARGSKMTRKELAAKLNMTLGDVAAIEAGTANYSGPLLGKINKILDSHLKK
jgi:ribosome-binding protein aMBF1 (putative translation factor)